MFSNNWPFFRYHRIKCIFFNIPREMVAKFICVSFLCLGASLLRVSLFVLIEIDLFVDVFFPLFVVSVLSEGIISKYFFFLFYSLLFIGNCSVDLTKCALSRRHKQFNVERIHLHAPRTHTSVFW